MEGVLVSVEADVSDGLPGFSISGQLASEVRESQDRVRTALKNSGFRLPVKGVTTDVNGQSTKASSRFVMDNNEFTLSTLNVSYRFERRYHDFIRKVGLSSASVALYLEDLVRLSTIKMERGIDYPFSRQVSMSLSLVF